MWETEYKLVTTSTTAPSSSSRTMNTFLIDLYESDDDEFAQRDKYDTYYASPIVDTKDALK